MVTFVYGCLAYLAICVGCGVLVAGMDAVDRLAARRAKRRRALRCDPLRLDGRGDAVEQAYADTPQRQEIARLHALAEADAAEAAFVSPGHALLDAFLAELFPRTKDAPKEQT